MNKIEYTVINSSPIFRKEYKSYGDFYTYYSKRGYYVATSEIGNWYSNGRIEAIGNTEKEAIDNYRIEIEKRISNLQDYLSKKLKENYSILKSINSI